MPTTTEGELKELDAQHRWQPLCLKLQNAENDYINASLVDIAEAQRSYILTQGPLPNACCHFWLMVWQQKTKAVVMLNHIVKKELVKHAQYWPKDDQEIVKLLSEDVKSYYTVHLLQIENINSGETRTISHFHYTTWPDFGVPKSPASFLNFLFKVRKSGSWNPDHGPAVIHCSAGIGHSGTFSLVDTCLVLMEKGDDINIKQVLLNMRKYRMGFISDPRSTEILIHGYNIRSKCIKGDSRDLSPAFDHSPNKIMTEKYNGNRIGLSSKMQDAMEENNESALPKCIREDRKATTAQKVQQMKQRLNENERKRKSCPFMYWLTSGFCSIPLIYFAILIQIQHCFDHFRFIINCDVR
uniref:Tyrosine-protein phosphatase non-receptor type n=2 Tax=Rhinopithecus TaxID=542827 RepID=A0A2K6K7M7_RHIBE